MEIDQKLTKLGFKWITNFQYNFGDCLLHAIIYLLRYSITSILIWMNFMFHL